MALLFFLRRLSESRNSPRTQTRSYESRRGIVSWFKNRGSDASELELVF